ncbi:long-chain acyl-CoA synthetase [Alicyclobacillus sacchari]|uniref:Long-chain acyl-CoA synthetase n=1 Tax=Alicyclobacillus sacchari TaxID=392010 RepID=A0A4R8LN48_9BACL|nr:long-chain fatty acid--CoA ligase [Alicyclobacillus sacchari]TDY46329.1 long-chain acyl-CoA synthetase [Alicyclobacillus sacchari]GMA57155.1 long-chain-fatty-acid--CoA ligase [Alicyclobacillus sacchari]
MLQGYGFQHYPAHIPTSIDVPEISMRDVLLQSVETYRDCVATWFYGQQMTYGELRQAVDAFAAGLQGMGVGKGDRVAIMLPNCPQYVIAYYGILSAGAIVAQMNPMSMPRELQHILADSGAKVIVTLDALVPRVQGVQGQTDLEHTISVSLQAQDSTPPGAIPFANVIQSGLARALNEVAIHPAEDVAVLQYTGGTTGLSKGAMLTHRNLVANTLQCYYFFRDSYNPGHDTCLTVLPLFHVFGMTVCMNVSIYNGARLLLIPRFDPVEVAQIIKAEQPTMFPGVPTMYTALLHLPNIEDYGLRSIRVCNSGGAPMPVELMREFEAKTGSVVYEGFGLSEASPVTHCNSTFAPRKPGTIGLPYPSTEYKIVDLEDGVTEVPVGQLGELVIRGPQVMKGYWNMPEETARALRDGWLYTGDIATVDEDGYVSIVDRKKDMIIASGYNIYPREVEEVLYEHPAVQEAIVVGVPDAYRGETVKAFIVRRAGAQVTEDEIIAHCKAGLSAYKVPKLIEFRNELPKSSVGKLLRRALREESTVKVDGA